ncbi:MAG: type VI secretion system baseplate subunit TssF [Colwellia sp.]
MPDFLHYYQEELRYLSESGKEFADSYPDVAHYLNMSANEDRDPYVERLFEGFAFLTARIQEKLSDDFPEFSQNLMEMVAPDFLRPFPSIALLEFHTAKGMLPQSTTIEKGTAVLSNPKQGVPKPCRFETTQDIAVHPLQLKQTHVNRDPVHGLEIALHFEIEETVEAADLTIEHLDIFLDGAPELAWMLYYFFSNSLESVTISSKKINETLDNHALTLPGLFDQTKILPEKNSVFQRGHLLREYFSFPEKFRFIRIEQLAAIKRMEDDKQFSLLFRFNEQLPDDIFRNLGNECFKLYCTPVANVFKQQTEPVAINAKHFEFLIKPDQNNDKEVYSLFDVSGRGKAAHEIPRTYVPNCEFRHNVAAQNDSAQGFYYSVKQEEKKGGGKNTLISINRYGGIRHYKEEFLTIEAYCTNGLLPQEKLNIKDICNPVPGFADYLKFSNFTKPSAMIPAVTQSHYLWNVLSHMNIPLKALCDTEVFKEMLHLYAWGSSDENKKRVDAISNVQAKHQSFFVDGHFTRGTEVTITITDAATKRTSYEQIAYYRLLGIIVQQFLGHYAAINYLISVKLVLNPAGLVFEWEPERALCHTI